jgi:hypothetical protein
MAENDDAVRRTLALAAEQLDMDVAVLDEVTRDEEIVRFSAGDTRAMGIAEGAPAPRPLVRAQIRIVLSPRDARHFVLCCLSRQREAKLGKAGGGLPRWHRREPPQPAAGATSAELGLAPANHQRHLGSSRRMR